MWGAFCWHGFGLLVRLEGKSIKSCSEFYPVIKHFYPDAIELFRITVPPSIGHKGSLKLLWQHMVTQYLIKTL